MQVFHSAPIRLKEPTLELDLFWRPELLYKSTLISWQVSAYESQPVYASALRRTYIN